MDIKRDLSSEDVIPLLFNKDTINDFLVLQQIYSAGIKEIKTKLEILDDEFRVRHDHNPIHHMEHRLKSPESIAGKLTKRGHDLTIDSIYSNLRDVAGIRVICNYIDDIYRVYDLLTKQNDIVLIEEKDYIKNPKDNGYRSLHIVVEIPIFLSEKVQTVPVEIQIRTIAMDFWASLEHHLRYKSDSDISDNIRNELLDCAYTSFSLDRKMQDIHNHILSKNKEDEDNL